MSGRRWLAGIDIGGTFTDVVVLDPTTGTVNLAKVPTTPADRAGGFFAGLEAALAEAGAEPAEVAGIVHGSTVATNAVLERAGSRLGLLVTGGFRDILEIGRAYIPGIFTNYMRWEKPPRLVAPELVREVPERLAADGTVVRPPDEAAARVAIAELAGRGIEALAICLLHSYANPTHERRLAELAAEVAPGLPVSLSCDVLPEYREYERTVTTALNAYVLPAVDRYLGNIETGLTRRGYTAPLRIMRSDAGIMSVTAARERPVNTVLSGPAGGVLGASWAAASAGYRNLVSLDMGGTSTDVCLTAEGEPRLSTDTWIADYPIRVAIIDITTIGAGGGSIAAVSPAGALRVGPRSAGAEPGPACYGRGGTLPTVTDANLVLGRLPASLAGGGVPLDVERARAAVEEHVARPLGLTVEAAAEGIVRVVDEGMLGALRVVSVQRGIDPRELVLVPFGGAGPVHGAELARLAGIATALVPAAPGVLSALGFLVADTRQSFARTRLGTVGRLDAAAYAADLAELTAHAATWLEREGVAPDRRALEVGLDVRYSGQAHEITIPASGQPAASAGGAAIDWTTVAGRFHAEHRRRYGFDQPFAAVEVVTLRVTAIGRTDRIVPERQPEGGADPSAALLNRDRAWFHGAWHETPHFDRARLRPGNRLDGPAIVVQPDCTTVLGPGQSLRVDGFGNLMLATGANA